MFFGEGKGHKRRTLVFDRTSEMFRTIYMAKKYDYEKSMNVYI
jgi:hypothetical protein